VIGVLRVGQLVAFGLLVSVLLSAAALDWLLARRSPVRRVEALTLRRVYVARGPFTWRRPPVKGHSATLTWLGTARPLARVAVALGAALAVLVVVGGSSRSAPDGAVVSPVVVPLVLAACLMGTTGAWLTSCGRSRRQLAQTRAQVVEACEALASGLRAGLPPERVLSGTADDLPLLVPAATAAKLGADVGTALRSAATRPGADRLAMLASAWDVARRSGAGLADVVSRIAVMVRADAGRQRQIEAALGGARSTARLFAVLPVLGLALGAGMDADPLGVLTRSAVGAWCLCLGTALACLGLVWVERLAAGAQR